MCAKGLPPDELASQFASKYYGDLQADRDSFVKLYYVCSPPACKPPGVMHLRQSPLTTFQRENSTLTFESETCQGVEAIRQKWTAPYLDTARYQITTTNAQRVSGDFVMILVTGLIQLTENDAAIPFAHSFLINMDSYGFFCNNDVFKLVY
ncbi:nuclear transport factor 2 domain-containing protein [Trichoderma harzianum]|uniref:NTF2-related export protein n=1 Tax=Trichoderma harzianum TaxID=5544 RepID=A0A0F9ZUH1_TRIHA|nr:nuclear transport factor 2 domain-containing protein [Trichoderma harzianum]